MKYRLIEFAVDHPYLGLPASSKKYIPDWYKKAERFVGGKPILNSDTIEGQQTVKLCPPYLDSLTSGYIAELWQDLQVRQIGGVPNFTWLQKPEILEGRPAEIVQGMPISTRYGHDVYAWKFPYYFRTPPGYSAFVSHPFNRLDLPFQTLSAVIDSDCGVNAGNIPFVFEKDWEGIVPQGTPILQILPFKRENWTSKENKDIIEIGERNRYFSTRKVSGFYKQTFWRKKNYD